MVFYTDQSPLFFRKIAHNERYRRPSWPEVALIKYLKGGGLFGKPEACPPSRYIRIELQNGCKWSWAIDLDGLSGKGDCEQSINVITDSN